MSCLVLFTGGTRSGKSAMAQRWAERRGEERVFLATCRVDDGEMAARIALHQKARGDGWKLIEETIDPLAALQRIAIPGRQPVLLLDCVSTWVANLMGAGLDCDAIAERTVAFAHGVRALDADAALVTAETGLGIVPVSTVGRRFRDVLGTVNQKLASVCDHVVFACCGLPLALKGPLPEGI